MPAGGNESMLPLPLAAMFWSYAPFWSKPPLLVGNPDMLLVVGVSQYDLDDGLSGSRCCNKREDDC